jgi:hypothetical protein
MKLDIHGNLINTSLPDYDDIQEERRVRYEDCEVSCGRKCYVLSMDILYSSSFGTEDKYTDFVVFSPDRTLHDCQNWLIMYEMDWGETLLDWALRLVEVTDKPVNLSSRRA